MAESTRQQVEDFLREFRSKLEVWGVLFIQRQKNWDTIRELEITYHFVEKKVLPFLSVSDYANGPLPADDTRIQPLWIFGTQLKNKELYIKISLGIPGSQILCISFHLAEYPLIYPFRV